MAPLSTPRAFLFALGTFGGWLFFEKLEAILPDLFGRKASRFVEHRLAN